MTELETMKREPYGSRFICLKNNIIKKYKYECKVIFTKMIENDLINSIKNKN